MGRRDGRHVTELEGKREQAEGDLQQKWGETKDAARDIVDDKDDD